jgi:hypothetical protein
LAGRRGQGEKGCGGRGGANIWIGLGLGSTSWKFVCLRDSRCGIGYLGYPCDVASVAAMLTRHQSNGFINVRNDMLEMGGGEFFASDSTYGSRRTAKSIIVTYFDRVEHVSSNSWLSGYEFTCPNSHCASDTVVCDVECNVKCDSGWKRAEAHRFIPRCWDRPRVKCRSGVVDRILRLVLPCPEQWSPVD